MHNNRFVLPSISQNYVLISINIFFPYMQAVDLLRVNELTNRDTSIKQKTTDSNVNDRDPWPAFPANQEPVGLPIVFR